VENRPSPVLCICFYYNGTNKMKELSDIWMRLGAADKRLITLVACLLLILMVPLIVVGALILFILVLGPVLGPLILFLLMFITAVVIQRVT